MSQIKSILNPVGVEINDKFEGNLSCNFTLKDFLQIEENNSLNLGEKQFYYSKVIHAGEHNGKKIAWMAYLVGAPVNPVNGKDQLELDQSQNSHLALALAYDTIGDSDDFDESDKIPAKIKITLDEVLIGESDGSVQLQKQHNLETEHEFSTNDPYFIFLFKKYPSYLEILENEFDSEQLQFRCKIKLHFSGQNFKCEKQKCAVDHMRNIEASSTDEFSDFEIKVGETVFKKHKIVLARCPYFRRLFDTDMVESAQSLVEIKDFSPQIVSKMLDYLYTGQIGPSNGACEDLELHRIADKYGILDLKEELESKIAKKIPIESACQIFKYADAIGSKDLKENAIKFIIDNRRAVTNTEGFNELKSSPDLLMELCKEISKN